MRRWSFDYEYGFYSYLEGLISFQIILYLFIYLILPVFKFLTLSFMFIRSNTSVQEAKLKIFKRGYNIKTVIRSSMLFNYNTL